MAVHATPLSEEVNTPSDGAHPRCAVRRIEREREDPGIGEAGAGTAPGVTAVGARIGPGVGGDPQPARAAAGKFDRSSAGEPLVDRRPERAAVGAAKDAASFGGDPDCSGAVTDECDSGTAGYV